jgi:hypothetical protein
MNKKLTEIIFVLDKSGSMGIIREDTIGGFNTFIQDQKELPGDCIFTMATFNTQYDKDFEGKLIESVNELDNASYRPCGGTALLDAVGRTINDVVTRHSTLGDEKPGKVMLVVLTDGEENSSIEFTKVKDVAKMVKKQEDTGWEIIFLGADIDAWGDGRALGFTKMKSMNKMDMKRNMSKMSNYTAFYRSAGPDPIVGNATLDKTFDMSDEELATQMEELKNKK